jgi:hypothetical protein
MAFNEPGRLAMLSNEEARKKTTILRRLLVRNQLINYKYAAISD